MHRTATPASQQPGCGLRGVRASALAARNQVALTRLFALGPALAVAIGTVSHQTLFNNINEYLNILQSVQLPFAMLPVLHFSASPALLGRFRTTGAPPAPNVPPPRACRRPKHAIVSACRPPRTCRAKRRSHRRTHPRGLVQARCWSSRR